MRVRPAFYERSHCNLPQLLSGISFVYTETDEEKVLHYSQLIFVRRRFPITGFPLTYARLTRLENDLRFISAIPFFPALSRLYSCLSLSLVSIILRLPSPPISGRRERKKGTWLYKGGKPAVRI